MTTEVWPDAMIQQFHRIRQGSERIVHYRGCKYVVSVLPRSSRARKRRLVWVITPGHEPVSRLFKYRR